MSNKVILQQYLACIARGGNYQAFYSDDIVWHLPGSHPFGLRHQGIAQVRRMLERAGEELAHVASPCCSCNAHDMIEEHERIVLLRPQRWISAINASHQRYDHVDIFSFSEGKISNIITAFDTYDLYQQGLYQQDKQALHNAA